MAGSCQWVYNLHLYQEGVILLCQTFLKEDKCHLYMAQLSRFDLRGHDSGFRIHYYLFNFPFLLIWAFSQQVKKVKIIGIVNGSVKFESYLSTLDTELCWLCSFFFYWFFPFCSQLSQLILKNPILKFPKNVIKPPLIWVVLTL